MKTATVKFNREDHEHRRSIQRAAGPMKPKTAYNRHDNSWRKEF